jgi:hypothetical protein
VATTAKLGRSGLNTNSDVNKPRPLRRGFSLARQKERGSSPGTIKLIVDGYLTLKDRSAIEDLRAGRERLRKQIQDRSNGCFDVSKATDLFDVELRIIQAVLTGFQAGQDRILRCGELRRPGKTMVAAGNAHLFNPGEPMLAQSRRQL